MVVDVVVIVVWYGRGYGAHCRRDKTNRPAEALSVAAVVVPPKPVGADGPARHYSHGIRKALAISYNIVTINCNNINR